MMPPLFVSRPEAPVLKACSVAATRALSAALACFGGGAMAISDQRMGRPRVRETRKTEARTWSRSVGAGVGAAGLGAFAAFGLGFGFALAGGVGGAAFAALRAASVASRLVAKSLAPTSTASVGEPSRAMR
jgi:hypothetical protein